MPVSLSSSVRPRLSAFNVHERSARTSVTRPARVGNSEVTTARVNTESALSDCLCRPRPFLPFSFFFPPQPRENEIVVAYEKVKRVLSSRGRDSGLSLPSFSLLSLKIKKKENGGKFAEPSLHFTPCPL